MDSEKYLKLEKQLETGESPTDEGPFYHHSWWESYKGSIKGKLGGIVIGMGMGAIVGAAVAAAMVITGGFAPVLIGTAFAGLTGAGILYGVYEFSEIGKIVGAQAAGLEQADAREAIRFSAIEKKIDALTTMVKAKQVGDDKSVPEADTSRESEALASYRKTHYAKLNGSTKGAIFWRIALIGLAIGMATGGILAIGGVAAHIFGGLGLSQIGTAAVSVITFGMFGASFGINRDIFRKVFDTTDLWTKGIFTSRKVREQQEEIGKRIEESSGKEHKSETQNVATVVAPEGYIDYPKSSTHHRDRVLPAAERALLSFDHTRATPQ